MGQKSLSLHLSEPDATEAVARHLARHCAPGDVFLLQGDVGAGKTHFARAFIRSLLSVPEDIPSPTFTIVQTYDTEKGEVWHCDLYRVGVSEIDELGLDEAFETAVTLIEWPDRLGPLLPQNALVLTFRPGSTDTSRDCDMSWSDPKWDAAMRGLQND